LTNSVSFFKNGKDFSVTFRGVNNEEDTLNIVNGDKGQRTENSESTLTENINNRTASRQGRFSKPTTYQQLRRAEDLRNMLRKEMERIDR